LKRFILNGLALVVIVGGASELKAQTEISAWQACCYAKITNVKCCGATCDAGWFQCSAST